LPKGNCWQIYDLLDWSENKPGFVEIDLVGHDGGNARGEYIQTLDVTDVCTGWTETQAVKNRHKYGYLKR
jgi:hypothetical protein